MSETIKTCGNCKYLGDEIDYEWYDENYEDVETVHTYHTCNRIKLRECRHQLKYYPAHVVDGSGYFAALRVTADFGCNSWEETNGK